MAKEFGPVCNCLVNHHDGNIDSFVAHHDIENTNTNTNTITITTAITTTTHTTTTQITTINIKRTFFTYSRQKKFKK